jgi:hypothetical protein
MTTNLRDITIELTYALAQLGGDSPTRDHLSRARDAIRRAQDMLDALLAKSEQWTVEEILAREG